MISTTNPHTKSILQHSLQPCSNRSAEIWCRIHPDARESGADDEHLISIQECAKRIVVNASERSKSLAMARQWDIVNNECRTSGRLGIGSCAERDKLDVILTKRGCVYIGYDAPIGKRDRYKCNE